MLRTLFVRPHPFNGDLVEWGIYEENKCVRHSKGFVDRVDLPETGDFYEAICVAPSARMFATQVSLPNVNARMLNRALPYAIEEHVATDVDRLHLTITGKKSKNEYYVTAVEKELLENWLGLGEAEWGPLTNMVPDALCLPHQDKSWSILIEDDHAFIRLDEHHTLYAERENVVSILDGYYQAIEKPPELIRVFLADPDGEKLLVATLENHLALGPETAIEVRQYKSALNLFAKGYEDQDLANLLQGQYRPLIKKESKKSPWRLPMGIAAAWLFLSVGSHWYEASVLDSQANYVKKASRDFFRELFPNERRIQDIRRQMKPYLAGGESASGSFVSTLAGVGVVKQQPAFDKMIIRAIRFNENRGGLFLEMNGDSVATFEKFKTALSEAGLEAELASVSSQNGQVQGRVRVGGMNG